ncbi:MAG: YlxR family protein [Clostridia bacterium]
MNKKIPQRTCVGCKQQKDKNLLLRIVHTPEGQIVIDKSGKLNGRGVYICKDTACLNKCIKSKAISRSLSCEISKDVYKQLEEELLG